jgi:hypothetical protein
MLEHGWAVTRQMLAVPDGSPLGPAEQSGERSPGHHVDGSLAEILAVRSAIRWLRL